MIEAYKIAANLTITGDAHKKMDALSKSAKKLSDSFEMINRRLPVFVRNLEQMGRASDKIAPLMMAMSMSLRDMSKSMPMVNEGFTKFNSRAGNTERRLERISMRAENARVRLQALGQTAAQAGGAMGGVRIGSSGGGGAGGGARGVLGSIAAFSIAGRAKQFATTGFHQEIEYERSMSQLQAMGLSPSQMSTVRQQTLRAAPGITPAGFAESFVAAQMATQSFGMAQTLSPIIAQNSMIAQSLYGGMSSGQVKDAIRTAEMIGGSNPKKVAAALTSVLQMTALSGGSIMPSEQRTFMRQAAGSASRLSSLGYLSLEPIIQEYGGSRTGTALTTGLRAFSNPKIANFAQYRVDQLKRLGLWDTKTNRMKGNYLEMMQTDPFQFTGVWLNALKGHGITSEQGILSETTSAFPRTFGTMMSLMIKNFDKILRERQRISSLPAGAQLTGIAQTPLGFATDRASKAFQSLSGSVVAIASPTIVKGLNMVSAIFENLANFFLKNQSALQFAFPKALGSTLASAIPGGSIISSGVHALSHTDATAGSTKKVVVQGGAGNVYLDGHVVGKHVMNSITTRLNTGLLNQQGTSGSNLLTNPLPIGINNYGSQGI